MGLMGMDNNSDNQVLRPNARQQQQQPAVAMSDGGGRAAGSLGDQTAPGGGGGSGSGNAWGALGTQFSPSSGPTAAAAGGALGGMPRGVGAPQNGQTSEFSLGGGGMSSGSGSGNSNSSYPIGRGPDGGPLYGRFPIGGGSAAAGSDSAGIGGGIGIQEMNASSMGVPMPGGNGRDPSRSPVQPAVAPPPQPPPPPPPEMGAWKRYTSQENNNRPYWHNETTKETVSQSRVVLFLTRQETGPCPGCCLTN